MEGANTTTAIQRFLDDLAGARGESPAEPIVRDLLARAARRLHVLSATMLHHHYRRLTRPPLNLQADEMLSALVERLMKALRATRPDSVRQFFALANQHMRWELNDLARRLDDQPPAVELRDSRVAERPPSTSTSSLRERRILEAIDHLPEEEREAFNLVRIQGMAQDEAAELLEISTRTLQRRIQRGVILLSQVLSDLQPPPSA